MLTARSRPEDVLEGFASGADDYLPKPFELAILIARLDGLLRRSAWMRQSIARDAAGANSTAPQMNAAPSGEAQPESDSFTFTGKSIDFAELELRSLGQHHPPHSNGGGVLAVPGSKRRTHRLSQGATRKCLGIARGHGHARYRQFCGAAAALYRRRPIAATPFAHRARRRVSVYGQAGVSPLHCRAYRLPSMLPK